MSRAPAGPSTSTLRGRLALLAPYFAGTRRGFALVVVGAIVGAATEPAIPALLKPLLDSGFKAGKLPLWLVPVAIIGLFAIRGLAGFIAQYGLAWSSNRAVLAMRSAMFSRLLDAEPALFTRQSASTLTNTLAFEVQTGTSMLVNSLLTLLKDSLALVALLVYLLYLNWQLTLFVGVLFPTVAWVMRTLSRRLHRLTVQTQQATDELAYVVEENVLAWRMVRLHGAAASQGSRFRKVSEGLRRLSMKSVVANSTMTPVTQVLAACALSAVIVTALWQSGTAGGSVGSFAAFVAAMLMLVAPIKHLSEVAGPITRGLVALERGVRLIEDTPVERGGSFDPGRSRGALELRGVTLRYPGDQAPALAEVSLTFRVGEAVALVGPSGAGKSTLVNLLPRFLEPSTGEIVLDGTPLAQWNIDALRRQFALVSQDVVLFNDSVAANVALGSTPDRGKVEHALRAANLLDFVRSLPQGIDSAIGHNGSQMSGGQRQRLAIARAIYKDAPILLLDEATSALDSESERLVQQALDSLMRGRTSIVIAHRLSTIERADRIVVLEAGRVAQQGTHAQLLAGGGLYAKLHALQFSDASV
ncbi:MAG: lipid A export permease/ATP-binding protein MsbA [Rhizobacter sp.]